MMACGDPIVDCAFFRILERFVGLVDFLEAGLGVGFAADIGVIFPRQATIGCLDGVGACLARDAQDPVVVFELHDVWLPVATGLGPKDR